MATAASTNYSPAQLLEDFSLEMTGKDVPGLLDAAPLLPRGTRVNVTFLGNEDLQMRLVASKAVLDNGFVPVPHISARRLSSQAQLEERAEAASMGERDLGVVDDASAQRGGLVRE